MEEDAALARLEQVCELSEPASLGPNLKLRAYSDAHGALLALERRLAEARAGAGAEAEAQAQAQAEAQSQACRGSSSVAGDAATVTSPGAPQRQDPR